MKKIISRIVAVIGFSAALIYSLAASADVTYHGNRNGTHYVSCTGGCSFSNAGWGKTRACDSENVCMTFSGQVKEGRPGSKTQPGEK